MQAFADRQTTLAFTDEPQNPAEATELKGVHYLYVPVAVSATVVGFQGGDFVGLDIPASPLATFNLTPNMVAGLIDANYPGAYDSDLVMPPLVCKQIYGCGKRTTADNYDTFDLLNPPPTGAVGPQTFGSFFSSTESGASYQVTDWACSAPNVPFTVTVPLKADHNQPTPVQVTDPNTAATTLTTPKPGNPAWPPAGDQTPPPWPYPTCQGYGTLPVLAAQVNGYSFAETPALQVKALRGFAEFGGGVEGNHTLMGFGAMDWSEASYYGLNSASLQNAAGDFVSPSVGSVDAALNDATQAPDGVLQYNYDDTGDPNAYPMPLVTYALVSTTSQPAASSQNEGDLLTNLVCYSHSGGSLALPTGYVPMPTNLYNEALKEIDQTFPFTKTSCDGSNPTLPSRTSTSKSSGSGHAKSKSGPTRSTGHSAGTGTGTGRVPSTKIGSSGTTTGGSGVGAKRSSGRLVSKTAPGRHVSPQAPVSASQGPGKGFEPIIVALAEGTERWIVAGLGGAALLGLIIGPLVVLVPRARRRIRTLRKA